MKWQGRRSDSHHKPFVLLRFQKNTAAPQFLKLVSLSGYEYLTSTQQCFDKKRGRENVSKIVTKACEGKGVSKQLKKVSRIFEGFHIITLRIVFLRLGLLADIFLKQKPYAYCLHTYLEKQRPLLPTKSRPRSLRQTCGCGVVATVLLSLREE